MPLETLIINYNRLAYPILYSNLAYIRPEFDFPSIPGHWTIARIHDLFLRQRIPFDFPFIIMHALPLAKSQRQVEKIIQLSIYNTM